MAIETALRERLDGLASFLPVFEAPDFEFGSWNSLEAKGRGFRLPSFEVSQTVHDLVEQARELGWVQPEFDWRAWMRTSEARRLCEDRHYLAEATPEQLTRLLTAVIRQDHFGDRSLETSYQSGLLLRILRRASVLAGR